MPFPFHRRKHARNGHAGTYGLGKHTIDYTSGTREDNDYADAQVRANDLAGKGRQQRSVGSVMLRIGFHF